MAEIDDTGWHPDTQGERQAELDQGMLDAFPAVGNEFLDLTPDSFTGRSNAVLAEELISSENLTATFIELLDPSQATGLWVDYHLRLQSTRRKSATFSKIPARLEGMPGTLVGDKLVRYTPNDTLWRTPINGTDGNPLIIEANGITDDITLTATLAGPIDAVETGTTSWIIVDQVVGWESVESTFRATLGTEVEADSTARARLERPSSAALGNATAPAVTKMLFELNGVTDADINNNRSLFVVDGVPGKTIEAIVEGGDPQEVANTILKAYPGTSGFFGNITRTATVTFTRLDGTVVTITEDVSWTLPELIPIIALYNISYGRPEFAPDDQGVAIATEAAANYINSAGRGVDVVPSASASAIVAALPSASEPVIVAQVAIKGLPLLFVPVPISIRQRSTINPLAQSATVTGTQTETFNVPITEVINLSVDGDAPVSVTFAATDFVTISAARAIEVATSIAKQVLSLSAGVDEGAVELVSNTTGFDSSIEFLGSSSPGLMAVLGFVVGLTNGSDSDIEVFIV